VAAVVVAAAGLHPVRAAAAARPDDDPLEVTAELRRRVRALLDDTQISYADGAPAGAWWVPARLGGGAPTAAEGEAILDRRIRDGWTRRRARR
jgi:hypothetical protein